MANNNAICRQAARTTYHLLVAQQEPYKSLTLTLLLILTKNVEISEEKEKSPQNGQWAISIKSDKTERARGLGRKSKEEYYKEREPNERQETDIRHLKPPFGA